MVLPPLYLLTPCRSVALLRRYLAGLGRVRDIRTTIRVEDFSEGGRGDLGVATYLHQVFFWPC